RSNAPVAHCSAPPGRPKPSESSQTPTAPPSRIPRWAACSTSNTPLAVPLAQNLPPTDGKVPRYKCTLELPDSLVAHIVGHQGQGLKQVHDLSGSWLAAFTVGLAGSEGRHFVTIQGTCQQIGEALVVFGKRIAKKHVRAPRKQRSGNAVPAVAAPAPSRANTLSTLKPPTLSTPPPPPMARVPDSTSDFPEPADWDEPTPVPTPTASSLPAGSPMALSTPTPALLSLMVIDYAYGHYARGISTAPRSTNTACRSRLTQGR
ncbi:hypothetical protein C0993_000188, partial [Termitomyces sp. T159_Od127]